MLPSGRSGGSITSSSSGRLPLEITPGPRYVGRGGHKRAPALERFQVDVRGRDALDVGASTGGFTQVLLEAGAARVIALEKTEGDVFRWR